MKQSIIMALVLFFAAQTVHAAQFVASAPSPFHDAEIEYRVPHTLDKDDIERAERTQKAAKRLGVGASIPEKQLYCDPTQLPITILFSDYTINTSGQVIQDGGWTAAERDWLSFFFCKSLPVIKNVYGDPFKHYDLTLVKDLRYVLSSVFIPTTLEIRMADVIPPKWYPQLLVHELLHAWRWQWCLSCDHSTGGLYKPTLSGFEEGFAQGGSYSVMNAYVKKYGAFDIHVGLEYFRSVTGWDYDFRNDGSMTTEDFWSENGATEKLYERYETAAQAILKLYINTPDFYKEFNAAYFDQVNYYITHGDPNHVFTRNEIRDLITMVSKEIEGKSVSDWIDDQHIFDQGYKYGKKAWFFKHWWGPVRTSHYYIQFVETFPSGSEWSAFIAQAKGYLYHRLNGVTGNLNIIQAWDEMILSSHSAEMKDLLWWPPGNACGINNVCIAGIGQEELHIYQPPAPSPNTYYQVANPIEIQHPNVQGLYRFDVSYQNPHYVGNGRRPSWGIAYDMTQVSAEESMYAILGIPGYKYDVNKILGGIIGVVNGTVVVNHKDVPNVTEICPVINGAFICMGQPEWFEKVLNGNMTIAKSGVFQFVFTPSGSPQSYYAERVVHAGRTEGAHQFLFRPSDLTVLH
jgi:hypothetical protein